MERKERDKMKKMKGKKKKEEKKSVLADAHHHRKKIDTQICPTPARRKIVTKNVFRHCRRKRRIWRRLEPDVIADPR